jgi:hypothetical protein
MEQQRSLVIVDLLSILNELELSKSTVLNADGFSVVRLRDNDRINAVF